MRAGSAIDDTPEREMALTMPEVLRSWQFLVPAADSAVEETPFGVMIRQFVLYAMGSFRNFERMVMQVDYSTSCFVCCDPS